jgi:hypothetical protein
VSKVTSSRMALGALSVMGPIAGAAAVGGSCRPALVPVVSFERRQKQFPLNVFERDPLIGKFHPQVGHSVLRCPQPIGEVVQAEHSSLSRTDARSMTFISSWMSRGQA